MSVRILTGDCRELLRTIPAGSVNCCVTSPPYYGLRDYGVDGQMGLEETPEAFVEELVQVFALVREVLRDDGTLWLNIGDSYAGSWGAQGHGPSSASIMARHQINNHPKKASQTGKIKTAGVKPKDLYGVPWMLAFALRADGWYLRQDIIWSKPNPMPESVRDRCTKSHEYLFLLSKCERYHCDTDALREPASDTGRGGIERIQSPSARPPGSSPQKLARIDYSKQGRNKRSVWTIPTSPFAGAHFATFPPALVEPCILAGCPAGGVVLDPFGGAGTTGLVADRLQRDAILIELNPAYAEMALNRIRDEAPLFHPMKDVA